MATKARHLKTPLQLWVADNRKRLGLSPADLAQLTGVTTDTARGWESRGRPSEDAISVLERRFGTRAPREEQASGGGMAELVAAIRDQTAAISELVAELRQGYDVRLAAVEAAVALLAREDDEGSRAPELPRVEAGSGR